MVWYHAHVRDFMYDNQNHEAECGVVTHMLLAEAVIAELLGAAFIGYTSIKHIRGSEGIAVAALVFALVALFCIPLTANYLT